MNPHFRFLVDEAVRRGKHVIDRCNLTILLDPTYRDLPAWLADRGVEMVCSLPHRRRRNTDAQRGNGAFDLSLAALRLLNSVGYGRGNPKRQLTLMANPAGAFLAGNQSHMEAEWKEALAREHDVTFDRLIALNNMPCARFLEWLMETDNLDTYLTRLFSAFNPDTIAGLMCRNTLSVSWDGRVFDCDFNQMLDLPLNLPGGSGARIQGLDLEALSTRRIVTATHCFGCTAGSGSSCGGATAS
jgi:radical SAM/Cys-rich protein